VIAFSRAKDEKQIIVVSGRFYTQLSDSGFMNPVDKVWENTVLVFSSHLEGNYRDILSGKVLSISQGQDIFVQQIFTQLPLVVLEKI
jgi:maltooligosyltrehalose synthase